MLEHSASSFFFFVSVPLLPGAIWSHGPAVPEFLGMYSEWGRKNPIILFHELSLECLPRSKAFTLVRHTRAPQPASNAGNV